MAFEFGASASPTYGAFGQTPSRPSPGIRPGLHGQNGVQGMDMLALIQLLVQAQQQQGAVRGAQQREVLNPVHRGMGGGVIDETTGKEAGNPFDSGFFQGANSRIGIESERLGEFGATGVSAGLAPRQFNPDALQRFPVGNVTHVGDYPQPQSNGTMIPMPGGGVQGMINPNAPQATKYSDANMWTAKGYMGKKPKPRQGRNYAF